MTFARAKLKDRIFLATFTGRSVFPHHRQWILSMADKAGERTGRKKGRGKGKSEEKELSPEQNSTEVLKKETPEDRKERGEKMFQLMKMLYKPHPWHGVSLGKDVPAMVTAYVECVPGEGIKYEVDKETGYLKVDRPHKFSSLCPTIYGFLPQTYCGELVAERCMEKTQETGIAGDGDPIDVCILSTRAITHGDLLVKCRPIGGLRMIDGGEADDKIIAVVNGDAIMAKWETIKDVPQPQLDVIMHYFLSYKQSPTETTKTVRIPEVYGRDEAYEMIGRSQADYQAKFSSVKHDFANGILQGLKKELASSLLGI
eukprot:g46682.t1